jgi:hypothetical protein
LNSPRRLEQPKTAQDDHDLKVIKHRISQIRRIHLRSPNTEKKIWKKRKMKKHVKNSEKNKGGIILKKGFKKKIAEKRNEIIK